MTKSFSTVASAMSAPSWQFEQLPTSPGRQTQGEPARELGCVPASTLEELPILECWSLGADDPMTEDQHLRSSGLPRGTGLQPVVSSLLCGGREHS